MSKDFKKDFYTKKGGGGSIRLATKSKMDD